MLVKSTVFGTILCLFLAAKAEVTVEKNVYQNLGVSFAPNVYSNFAKEELVKTIQDLLRDTSHTLHTATGYRIGSVSIHLPSSWDISNWTTPITVVDEDPGTGDIVLVDSTFSNGFGNNPHTLQYGGCGSRGLPITVPLNFFTSDTSYPKEKLLAREWIKYRFGVFDENGFPNDPLYPTFYKVPGSVSEIRITECTHPQVEYDLKKKDKICSMEQPDHDDCLPIPKDENITEVKSSFMFFHEALPHMDEVCGRSDNVHNVNSYSKHNILCEGWSVWDVIKQSTDHAAFEEVEWSDDDIQFTFQQKTKPKFIVAVEKTGVLNSEAPQIVFALRRLLFDAWNNSKSGVYTFDDKNIDQMKALGEGYSDLAISDEFHGPSEGACISCVLKKAAEDLLGDNKEGKGTILLITGSLYTETDSDVIDMLKSSNLCVSVIVFADDEETAQFLMDSYKVVTDDLKCPSNVTTVIKQQDAGTSYRQLISLMRSYITVQLYEGVIQEMVQTSLMGFGSSITFPVTPDAAFYGLWLSKNTDAKTVTCKSGDQVVDLTKVDTYAFVSTAVSYYIMTPRGADEVVCNYTFSTTKIERFAEIVAYKSQDSIVTADLWIQYTAAEYNHYQGPVMIYFRLDNANNPIRDAKVEAKVLHGDEAFEIQLFDNGRGDPDITYHDGVYSGYFMNFTKGQEYTLTATATHKEKETRVGKYGKGCCGSFVEVDIPAEIYPFELEKSITFTVDSDPPKDGFRPSRVIDLKVEVREPSIILTWTAPGVGKAESYSIKIFSSRKKAMEDFFVYGTELKIGFKPANHGVSESYEIDLTDLQNNSTYFVAMRTTSELKKQSETSNIVEFFLPEHQPETTTLQTSSTTETTKKSDIARRTTIIVISVLASIIVVSIVGYVVFFFVCRRKDRRDDKEANKNGATQQKGTPTIPLGGPQFNSIPADVILKHHNEVVEAKNLHKDPPVFTEESMNSTSTPDTTNKNNASSQYTLVDRRRPDQTPSATQDPSKSPKRMTVV